MSLLAKIRSFIEDSSRGKRNITSTVLALLLLWRPNILTLSRYLWKRIWGKVAKFNPKSVNYHVSQSLLLLSSHTKLWEIIRNKFSINLKTQQAVILSLLHLGPFPLVPSIVIWMQVASNILRNLNKYVPRWITPSVINAFISGSFMWILHEGPHYLPPSYHAFLLQISGPAKPLYSDLQEEFLRPPITSPPSTSSSPSQKTRNLKESGTTTTMNGVTSRLSSPYSQSAYAIVPPDDEKEGERTFTWTEYYQVLKKGWIYLVQLFLMGYCVISPLVGGKLPSFTNSFDAFRSATWVAIAGSLGWVTGCIRPSENLPKWLAHLIRVAIGSAGSILIVIDSPRRGGAITAFMLANLIETYLNIAEAKLQILSQTPEKKNFSLIRLLALIYQVCSVFGKVTLSPATAQIVRSL